MKKKTKKMLAKLLGKDTDEKPVDKIKAKIDKMMKEISKEHDCEAHVVEFPPDTIPDIIKYLLGSGGDNSSAHVTNVETLCSTICDRIVRLRDAIEVLSYTQPDNAEYLRQVPVRIGKKGFEYKVRRSDLRERGLLDWAYDYLGPKDHQQDEDKDDD